MSIQEMFFFEMVESGKENVKNVKKCLYKTIKDNRKIIPDIYILNTHINRCVYVLDMWNQARKRNPKYNDINDYGWIYQNKIISIK